NRAKPLNITYTKVSPTIQCMIRSAKLKRWILSSRLIDGLRSFTLRKLIDFYILATKTKVMGKSCQNSSGHQQAPQPFQRLFPEKHSKGDRRVTRKAVFLRLLPIRENIKYLRPTDSFWIIDSCTFVSIHFQLVYTRGGNPN